MMVDQVISKLLLAGVTVLVARGLGPEQFGVLSLALSIVIVCKDTIAPLGLGGVFVRELIENPTGHTLLLGSALLMRTFSGFGAFAIALVTLTYMSMDRPNLLQIGLVLSVAIFVPNIFNLYFEATLSSWRNAVSNTLAHGTALLLTALLYVSHANAIGFAAAIAVLYIVQSIAQTYQIAVVQHGLAHLRAKSKVMVNLLSESWPLIISGAAATVYNKIDIIMLGALSSATEVGTYAAASRIAESTSIFGLAIAASLFPGIVRARQQGIAAADEHFIRLSALMFYTGIFVSASLFISAPITIRLLFGGAFSASIVVLEVYSVALIFIYLGFFLSKWLIVERLVRYSIWRHALGACANILLNIILIPLYGSLGAALATVAAHFLAVCAVCAGNKRLRPALGIMRSGVLRPITEMVPTWLRLVLYKQCRR